MLLLASNLLLRRRNDWPTPAWLRTTTAFAAGAGAVISASAALALGRGLTASPLPNEHSVLRDQGLFAVVRHPIYSGLLLAVGARTVSSGDRRQLGVFALLAALLPYKAAFEERALTERFADYAAYAAHTPRLVPRLGKHRPPGDAAARRRAASSSPRGISATRPGTTA